MASGSGGRIVPPPVSMTITQIAVVVADMESALRSYTENLGWGPWSVFDYKPPLLHDTVVRGEKVEYRMIGAETSVERATTWTPRRCSSSSWSRAAVTRSILSPPTTTRDARGGVRTSPRGARRARDARDRAG